MCIKFYQYVYTNILYIIYILIVLCIYIILFESNNNNEIINTNWQHHGPNHFKSNPSDFLFFLLFSINQSITLIFKKIKIKNYIFWFSSPSSRFSLCSPSLSVSFSFFLLTMWEPDPHHPSPFSEALITDETFQCQATFSDLRRARPQI